MKSGNVYLIQPDGSYDCLKGYLENVEGVNIGYFKAPDGWAATHADSGYMIYGGYKSKSAAHDGVVSLMPRIKKLASESSIKEKVAQLERHLYLKRRN